MTFQAAPILIMAGAALVLSGRNRKKKTGDGKRSAAREIARDIDGLEPDDGESVNSDIWKLRQDALRLISKVEFPLDGGSSIKLCSKCDPMDSSGVPGDSTIAAVKAFQALAGLPANGSWGDPEDRAIVSVLDAIAGGRPISCDPLIIYPSPLGCFAYEDGFGLFPAEDLSSQKSDLLYVSDDCQSIIASDEWHIELNKKCILSALAGLTSSIDGLKIVEDLMAEHASSCVLIGKDGMGTDAILFWDNALERSVNILIEYEQNPYRLNEDAKVFGIIQ